MTPDPEMDYRWCDACKANAPHRRNLPVRGWLCDACHEVRPDPVKLMTVSEAFLVGTVVGLLLCSVLTALLQYAAAKKF